MVGFWNARTEDLREGIRSRRKLLYVAGICLLVFGIALDLLSVVEHEDLLAVPGIVLPVAGSVLLLLNYIAAMGRKGPLKHKDAKDEAAFGAMFYLYLGLCVLTLFLYVPQVLVELESKRDRIVVITPIVKPIAEISGVTLMMYFLFIVSVLVLAFNALTKNGFATYLKIFRGQPVPKEAADADPFFGNPISTILMFFSASLFFSIVFYAIVRASGVEPGVPDFGTGVWYHVYIFSDASVWEEIISRVLLLGVPLLFIDLIVRRKPGIKPWRYLLGGNMNIGLVEAGVALFSALMFGLAHVGAWDFYKVAPTAIGGLFLAYLFLKFGLYAAIMLHFIMDFFDIPLEALRISSDVGIPVIFLFLGLAAFLKYMIAMFAFVYHDLMKVPRPSPPPQPTAPTEEELEEFRQEQRILESASGKSYYAYGVTTIFVFLSSGIMIWADIGVAIDPEYGGLASMDDWIGFFSVLVPNLAAFAATFLAWKRGDVRTYMLAAMLSAFSFTGVLALVSEYLLWRAYKKHGAPW